MDWMTSSGNTVPYFSSTASPASRTYQLNSTPVASSTRRVASVISGPVPSPGIRVTSYGIARRLQKHHKIYPRENRRSHANSERGAQSSQKKPRRGSLNLGLYIGAGRPARARLNLPLCPADVSQARQPGGDTAVSTGAFVRRRAASGHPPAGEW